MRYLAAAAIGYVLGSRAGRARYEQIRRGYRKVADHPAVQSAAGVARAKVEEKVPFVHTAGEHARPNGPTGTTETADTAKTSKNEARTTP